MQEIRPNIKPAGLLTYHHMLGTQGRADKTLFYLQIAKLLAFDIFAIVFFISIDGLLSTLNFSNISDVLSSIFLLIFVALNVAVFLSISAQRLHDLNHRGWWALLIFIPFIGSVLFLYLIFANGTIGANRFGAERPDVMRITEPGYIGSVIGRLLAYLLALSHIVAIFEPFLPENFL
ncbi:MAG: DUF805 domain-containing protein [Alphaproteobacteria bacterium]|nr:DUF805 domain-containing protein [Alphaproteobacteria bacterium]